MSRVLFCSRLINVFRVTIQGSWTVKAAQPHGGFLSHSTVCSSTCADFSTFHTLLPFFLSFFLNDDKASISSFFIRITHTDVLSTQEAFTHSQNSSVTAGRSISTSLIIQVNFK